MASISTSSLLEKNLENVIGSPIHLLYTFWRPIQPICTVGENCTCHKKQSADTDPSEIVLVRTQTRSEIQEESFLRKLNFRGKKMVTIFKRLYYKKKIILKIKNSPNSINKFFSF